MPKCRFCGHCIGYEQLFCTGFDKERKISDAFAKRSRQCPEYYVAHDGKDTEDQSVDIWGEVNYYPNKNKLRIKQEKTFEKLKLL